jgi:peptidoglycan glycosyltransferase
MNAPLRRVGVVVLVLFALLFLNLNWVQAYKADEYRDSNYNARVQTAEYQRERGKIIVGGQAVAQSRETGDTLKYLRTYPSPELYAHAVGYKPVNLGATGIEKMENDYLSGNADAQFADRFAAMFTGEKAAGGNVVLSLSKATQESAFRELSNNRLRVPKGAIVALDPRTGAILAAVSIPSFDPNPLASHNTNAATAAFKKLEADQSKPLLNRAFTETYPPGSTMKVIISAAALANGDTQQTVLQAGPSYVPPQTTQPIRNAAPGICPEPTITLRQALTVSCNTAFARYGVERLGVDKVKEMAQAFGFESVPEIDRDDKNAAFNVAPSHTGAMTGPDGRVDPPALAQSCIGQRDVRMTPLQGALIAATVAHGGSQMRPYLVQELKGADLTTVHFTANPRELRRSINGQVARDLQDMMISVVDNGTGRNARIPGFRVGGKTGTAENAEEAADHGWFLGFALRGNDPVIAAAVFLENAGKGGSAEAARIAGQVMRAYIGEKGIR